MNGHGKVTHRVKYVESYILVSSTPTTVTHVLDEHGSVVAVIRKLRLGADYHVHLSDGSNYVFLHGFQNAVYWTTVFLGELAER